MLTNNSVLFFYSFVGTLLSVLLVHSFDLIRNKIVEFSFLERG